MHGDRCVRVAQGRGQPNQRQKFNRWSAWTSTADRSKSIEAARVRQTDAVVPQPAASCDQRERRPPIIGPHQCDRQRSCVGCVPPKAGEQRSCKDIIAITRNNPNATSWSCSSTAENRSPTYAALGRGGLSLQLSTGRRRTTSVLRLANRSGERPGWQRIVFLVQSPGWCRITRRRRQGGSLSSGYRLRRCTAQALAGAAPRHRRGRVLTIIATAMVETRSTGSLKFQRSSRAPAATSSNGPQDRRHGFLSRRERLLEPWTSYCCRPAGIRCVHKLLRRVLSAWIPTRPSGLLVSHA